MTEKKQRKNRGGVLHPYKPGQSGNPAGRPKGSLSLTTQLKALLREKVKQGGERKTRGERLMSLGLKAAEKGDYRFWKEIMDRVEGKVPEEKIIRVQVEEAVVVLLGVIESAARETFGPEKTGGFIDNVRQHLIQSGYRPDQED